MSACDINRSFQLGKFFPFSLLCQVDILIKRDLISFLKIKKALLSVSIFNM